MLAFNIIMGVLVVAILIGFFNLLGYRTPDGKWHFWWD